MKLVFPYGAIIAAAVVTLTGDADVFVAADDNAEETIVESSSGGILKTAEVVGLQCPPVAACELEMGTAFGDPWVKADAGDAGYFKVFGFHEQ